MIFDKQTAINFTPEEEQTLQKAETIINTLYEFIEEDEMLEIGRKTYTAEELEELQKFLFTLMQEQAYYVERKEK